MLNTITIQGRLTRDPELRKTSGEWSVCTFSIAVNRPHDREKTDFFTSTLPQYELRTSHCMFIYPYFANFPELVLSRLEYPDYFVVESGENTFRSIAESYGYILQLCCAY